MSRSKPKRKKLNNAVYYLYPLENNKKEVEIDIEKQTIRESDIREILKAEFGNARKRNLFFHVEYTSLVIGEIDWQEEAKKD